MYVLSCLNVNNQNPTKISKFCDMTYTYTVRVVELFQVLKWITREKIGRNVICTLTPNGKKIALLCDEVMRLGLDSYNENKNNTQLKQMVFLKRYD